MRLDFLNERVLAVVAHPDDAEYGCVGTLARAKADGAEVAICVLCTGDKGQSAQTIEDLAALRKREMTAAAELLGARLFRGGAPDGELFDEPVRRRELLDVFRQFQPTLVLTHSLEDYHADHRAAGILAEAVSWFCTSKGHVTATPPMASQPALWWMDTMNMAGGSPGFFVDISDYVTIKRRMLACHKSQLQRAGDGDFSPLEEQMLRQCEARGRQAGVAAAEAFRIHLAWKRARAW